MSRRGSARAQGGSGAGRKCLRAGQGESIWVFSSLAGGAAGGSHADPKAVREPPILLGLNQAPFWAGGHCAQALCAFALERVLSVSPCPAMGFALTKRGSILAKVYIGWPSHRKVCAAWRCWRLPGFLRHQRRQPWCPTPCSLAGPRLRRNELARPPRHSPTTSTAPAKPHLCVPLGTVAVAFHRAMTYYMLMEEDRAQKELQEVIRTPFEGQKFITTLQVNGATCRIHLVVPLTNPVTYPEPAQRAFPSPLWDGLNQDARYSSQQH